MDALNERLTVAAEEIKVVEGQLAAVERGLHEPDADISYLRKEKDQLREEKKQLREIERLILELILRQSPVPVSAPAPVAVGSPVADLAALLAEIRSVVANAMPASTKHGSRVGPEVYSTFYFAILEAHEFAQSVTDKTEVDLLSKYSSGEVFKSAVTTYANRILSLTNGIKETKTRSREVKDTQPLSKDLLKVLIKNFFIDEREGPEYSKAVLYHTVFNFVSYKGIGDHAISTGKKGATFILLWEDKIRLDSEANIESAISQAALEIKGEITRLKKSLNIFPVEYCSILTNGAEFILVSGYHVMAELKWRHSNTVSIAGEGTSHIKDEEIAKVVLLLAYAFTCANKVFDLIRNAPVPGPQHPPIEEADRDDQVEEIRVLFDSTNLNERPNRSGSSGVRSHGGNLKGGRGTNKTGTSSRADSGKNNCFRDFNTYQILTSERKQLHDKENVPFNSLSKAASTRLFF